MNKHHKTSFQVLTSVQKISTIFYGFIINLSAQIRKNDAVSNSKIIILNCKQIKLRINESGNFKRNYHSFTTITNLIGQLANFNQVLMSCRLFSTIKKLYYYCKYMYNTKHKMIKSTIFKQRLISKCNNIMHVKNLTQNRI